MELELFDLEDVIVTSNGQERPSNDLNNGGADGEWDTNVDAEEGWG